MPDADMMAEKLLATGWEVDSSGEVWTNYELEPEDTFALDEAYERQFPTISQEDLDQL